MLLNFIRPIIKFINFCYSKLNPSKPQPIKLKPVQEMQIKSEYRRPETRPAWVKGIFDDYVYGRIRSLTDVRMKIREGESIIPPIQCVKH